ncbi:SDR family oxidoreductase [Defluviimonas sp. WL0002]|uniref:SDR family oxidoreductase n=1 Tax=Albidovulum marisflavi TaxID=2984159 RepID=A0ABT2ZCW9_9RHOB|nr:SDR family oxidoreductase [Defluviimonas sp. WL0002]MCV2868946.1 SDR family oxidoreductase [Defluviimonas sp. WL0002]
MTGLAARSADPRPLAGRVAFVTGAGSGIGRAGAIAMAKAGAHVSVTDRDADRARETRDTIRDAGESAEWSVLDVADEDAVTAAISAVAKARGRIDILHSHAGVQIQGSLEEVTTSDMDLSWALNVRSHFVAARAAVALMRPQGGGSIIVTASNSGVQFDREMIAYATTKHAAVAMTRQMAADYARFNIRINALCPGFVDTPFNAGFESQMGGRKALERYVATAIPMGRWGDVREIAEAIVFLASDASSFMTGHALVIDGGESI